TSGEYRLSNFWLWEGSYSEFYFSSLLWPDFNKEALQEAILSYEKRDRRYGGIQR
ncbi:MAG: undecaprenyl diphosphate synthase family protein, partial [Aminobacterium colombiense]|nr:undecaprenyl diphosphate synthase family protein [Aminobacterium colombiense]MDD4585597.1 undecaprenyl diphosphate synthase family protein [Aminobacterium colombiense]